MATSTYPDFSIGLRFVKFGKASCEALAADGCFEPGTPIEEAIFRAW